MGQFGSWYKLACAKVKSQWPVLGKNEYNTNKLAASAPTSSPVWADIMRSTGPLAYHMSLSKTLLILLLLILFLALCAVITLPPQDVTILLGSTAVFNCTGEGDLLQWTYHGTTVDGQIAQQYQISIVYHNVSDGIVSSSLYINATIENDGQSVGCVIAFSNAPFDIVSAGAYLYVRRIGPVRDLSLSIHDVPYVTWTIPSVIAPDIPVTDIRYTVTLEGGNITSTVNDIDDTYYQFTDITVLNCTVYTATVTAYDDTHHSYTSDAASAENDLSKSSIIKHMVNFFFRCYFRNN